MEMVFNGGGVRMWGLIGIWKSCWNLVLRWLTKARLSHGSINGYFCFLWSSWTLSWPIHIDRNDVIYYNLDNRALWAGVKKALRKSLPKCISSIELFPQFNKQISKIITCHMVLPPKYRYWVLQGDIWASGYCVDTAGMDAEMIRKYVKYQDDKESLNEWKQLGWLQQGPLGFAEDGLIGRIQTTYYKRGSWFMLTTSVCYFLSSLCNFLVALWTGKILAGSIFVALIQSTMLFQLG